MQKYCAVAVQSQQASCPITRRVQWINTWSHLKDQQSVPHLNRATMTSVLLGHMVWSPLPLGVRMERSVSQPIKHAHARAHTPRVLRQVVSRHKTANEVQEGVKPREGGPEGGGATAVTSRQCGRSLRRVDRRARATTQEAVNDGTYLERKPARGAEFDCNPV